MLLTPLLHHLLTLLPMIRTLMLRALHSLAAAPTAPLSLRRTGLALLPATPVAAAFLTLRGRAAAVALTVATPISAATAFALTLRERIGSRACKDRQ